MMIKKTIVPLFLTILTALGGCGGTRYPVSATGTRILLDTVCNITIYGDGDADADGILLDEAFEICSEYEALLSASMEGSDIWRINHAGGEAVEASPATAQVIAAGIEFGAITGGMFDITVGRLTSLWDFKRNASVPAAEDIARALETVDYRQISVDGNEIRLTLPSASLDAGGIAKGYIADRVAEFLAERGARGAVVDLGGDVAVIGEKPDGKPWSIGVRKPYGKNGELLGIIETQAAAIATSGVYEREFTENGVAYHHILNPSTGMPAVTDVVSATVIADNAMTGDALATSLLLAGSSEARRLASSVSGFLGALLVLESGELVRLGEINFISQ